MSRERRKIHKQRLTVWFLLALCLAALPLHAEGLDQLVTEALNNNPDLAADKARWEQSTYRSPQVGSLSDPVVSFSFSSYPSDSLSSDETPMTGNELRFAQMFPFPGKLGSRSELAAEQALWFEAVYQDKRLQLARKVKDSWYRLYYKNQEIIVTERNLKLVDDIIRLTEVRYETGVGLQQDVLKAQLQRSRFMERLMSLRQQRSVVIAEFDRLLNRSAADYDIPASLDLPVVDLDFEGFYQAGRENRPLNTAYQSLINRYRQQHKLAELDDYPDTTLWASWRFRDDQLMDGGTDFVSAGVSFNLPIYREKRRAAKAEASAAIRMAEKQADNFHAGLLESIRNSYARMEETREQEKLYREGIIPQATQTFQAAMSSYQVGTLAFISLLDALMTTYQAELDYYRIASDYMRSLAWLEAESTVSLIGPALEVADQMPANRL